MNYVSGASLGTLVVGNNASGTKNTQLSFPTSVYFDSSSNSVVIVNFGINNVVCWALTSTSWTLVSGSISVASGNTSTLFTRSIGMTMDPMGNVYVADMINHRIQLFLTGQTDGITIAGVTDLYGSNST